jgi:Trypsin
MGMLRTDFRQYRCKAWLRALAGNARAAGWMLTVAGGWISLCGPAVSLVGGVPVADPALARHAVLLFDKRGMCSGAVVAQDVILTAAHCAAKLGKGSHVFKKPLPFVDVTDVAVHPQYARDARSSPDLALLKLSGPLPPAQVPVLLNTQPVAADESLFIVGYGRSEKDRMNMSATPRMAMLSAASRSEVMLRLVDPSHSGLMIADRGGKISGCDGDSGAPVFTMRAGVAALAGVLTGSNRDCAGITYVIPVVTYLGWIRETARNWGAEIDSR